MARSSRQQTSYSERRANKLKIKQEARAAKRSDKTTNVNDNVVQFVRPSALEVNPKTDRQADMISSIYAYTLTFATGSAGTGKTWIAIAVGIAKLLKGEIKRMILIKPEFTVDGKLYPVPGNEQEKLEPLMASYRDIFIRILGASHFENLVKNEKIIFAHLGNILGKTFDDALVIVDESQHCTVGQMMAVLTRAGENTKYVVIGDYRSQKFLAGRTGLKDALMRFRTSKYSREIRFTSDDIVRSGFCREVVEVYDDFDPSNESPFDTPVAEAAE